MLSFIEIVWASILIGFLFHWFQRRTKNFPPGPLGLPLVGSIPFLGRDIHRKLEEYGKTYGSIFSVFIGTWRCVVLTDPKHIREAFKESSFAGRPGFEIISKRGKGGILFVDGHLWAENRRFSMRHLRDFGFGKNSMETIMHQELVELIEAFNKEKGKISTSNRFNASVLNVLWAIVAGDRFKLDDPALTEIVKEITKMVSDNNRLHMFAPWLNKISPKLSGLTHAVHLHNDTIGFINKHFEEHKRNHVEDEPRDFIDVYIDMIKKTTDPNSVFHQKTGYQSAILSITDLFLAGSETTSTTLIWSFLLLGIFREKQKKLQAEIDQIVGNSRLPSLSDRPSMPYTEATIYEIMRFSSLVPLSLFHRAEETVEFHEFTIPKDTLVISNLYAVHHSESIWGDPKNFRPERFLSPDEKTVIRNDSLMAFSVGKRSCLGETLARDELFLFLTGLFQRFEVSPDPSNPNPDYLNPLMGTVLMPQNHYVNLKDRMK